MKQTTKKKQVQVQKIASDDLFVKFVFYDDDDDDDDE